MLRNRFSFIIATQQVFCPHATLASHIRELRWMRPFKQFVVNSSAAPASFFKMNPIAIFIAVSSALVLAAAANVSASLVPPPDPKYSVMEITWAVESIPGNATSTVLLNGTVQEVYKRLTEINPDYDNLLDKYRSSKASTALPHSFNSFDSMADVPSNCGYCNVCTKRWEPASYMIILDGINYLNSLLGKPGIPPGPGFCSRVSCNWGSSIWWCNDNDERTELDSWSEITSAAEDITRQCCWTTKEKELVTGGQIFQPGGWNVVIRHDEDC